MIFREVGARRDGDSGAIHFRFAAMHAASASIASLADVANGANVANVANVVSHRAYLVRFATRKLHDPMLAEDAVHDVFEAVLSGRATFAGRSALRSWLTGVLKHKIVDTMRKSPLHESLDGNDDDEPSAAHDVASPEAGPEALAEHRERLGRVLAEIDRLPAGLRDAMRLRVIEEGSADDVCAALGISEENLFVRVHRARKRLLS